MAFETAINSDVLYFGEGAGVTADEDAAVAVERIPFCAHQGDAVLIKALSDTFDPGFEGGSIRDPFVIGPGLDVAFGFVPPGSQFFSDRKSVV